MRSLFLYGCAGAVGTAAHFVVLFATLGAAGPVLASTLGAVTGCAINYFLARQFVFSQQDAADGAFTRFAIVALFGIVANAVVIRALVDSLPIALNQAVASMSVLLPGYSLNRRWTFNERSS